MDMLTLVLIFVLVGKYPLVLKWEGSKASWERFLCNILGVAFS